MPGALYVTYDGLLEPLGSSQVLPYVEGLRERGYPVTVLSFEKPEDTADPNALAAMEERVGRAGIAWERRRYHRRPTLPATLRDVHAGRRFVARWARGAGRDAVVHARGYLPGLMALAAESSGPRILFDMRGFWVDERIEGGYWAPGGVQVRIGRWIERRVLARADHVISLTRRGAERLSDLTGGGAPPPWTVIPTCVDMARFHPGSGRAAARAALGLDRGPVLVHVGTLTGWYDGPATMRVGRAWVERTGGTFVVLTRSPDEARAMATQAGVEPVIRTAAPPEMPAWLQAADAGLALVRPSPSKDASFATKIGEYLAAGVAVLATPIGDMETLADGDVLRLLRRGDDEGAVVSGLAEAAGAAERVARARALAEEHLSLARGVERLAAVYRMLGVGQGAA